MADNEPDRNRRTVLVHGASRLSRDTLEMLFENSRRSGGGDIENLLLFKECDLAVITYQKQEDAQSVIQRGEITCEGHTLMIQENKHPRSIQVHGITSKISQDFLEMFLESEKRSSGGQIESVDFYDVCQGVAVYTFKEETVAHRLINKPLILNEIPLIVTPRTITTDPNVVIVKGIDPLDHTRDYLSLFFESKKLLGDEVDLQVDDIQLDETQGTAAITYADEEAAKRVLAKKTIRMSNSEVELHPKTMNPSKIVNLVDNGGPSTSTSPNIVVVRGFTPSTTEELIRWFFEKPQKCGGGEIGKLEFDAEKCQAVITYKSKDVAKRVLNQPGPVVLENATLSLSNEEIQEDTEHKKRPLAIHVPENTSDESEAESESRSDSEDQDQSILVENIPANVDEETLSLYFEHPGKTGGGEIKEMKYNPVLSKAVITYSKKVAHNVLRHTDDLRLKGQSIRVSQWEPSKSEDQTSTILVSGMAPTTTMELAELFFEKHGGEVASYDSDSGQAVVTFKDMTAAQKILSLTQPLTLDKSTLSVTPWIPANQRQVMVEGVTGIDQEKLKLYFELERRSGGGSIEDMSYDEQQGKALITFEKVEVAERVLTREEPLELGNHVLTVKRVPPLFAHRVSSVDGMDTVVVEAHEVLPSEEKLRQYFNDIQHAGGGHVTSVKYSRGNKMATIQFDQMEVVKQILGRSEFDIQGIRVTARRPDTRPKSTKFEQQQPQPQPQPQNYLPRCLKICQLPQQVTQSKIRQVIMNTGCKDLESIDIKQGEGSVILCFKNTTDASILLSKQEVHVDGILCPIHALDTSIQEHPDFDGTLGIKVSGIPTDVTENTIDLFFTNQHKSGGGPCSKIHLESNKGCAFITYQSAEVLRNVLEMYKRKPETFNFNNKRLSITRLPLPEPSRVVNDPTEVNKFILLNAPDIMLDEIALYFSEQVPVIGALYGVHRDSILLTLGGKPDYRELLHQCTTRPLIDRMVTLQKLPKTCVIQAYSSGTTKPLNLGVEGYFQSTEPVQITECKENGDEYLLIHYRTPQDAQNQVGKIHSVNGEEIKTYLYYPDFGPTPPSFHCEKPWSFIPDPFTMLLTSPHILHFFNKSSKAKDRITETALKESLFYVDWDNSSPDALKVCCIPQELSKLNLKKRDPIKWEHDCRNLLDAIISNVEVFSISTLDELFDEILAEAEKNVNQEDMQILAQRDQASLTIVGWEDCVERKRVELNKTNKSLIDDLTREKDSIQETIKLQPHQCELLKAVKYTETLRSRFTSDQIMQISIVAEGLQMKGIPDSIQTAKEFLNDEILHQITTDDFEKADCDAIFQSQETRDYLEKQLQSHNLNVVMQPTTSGLTLYASSQDMKGAGAIIDKHIVSKTIQLSPDTAPVMQSKEWGDLKRKLTQQNKGTMSIREDPDSLTIVTIADIHSQVVLEVEHCFSSNALKSEFVPLLQGEVRLLMEHGSTNELIQAYQPSMVSFVSATDSGRPGIRVLASSQVIKSVTKDLEDKAKAIQTHDCDIKPWISKYYQSSQGKNTIQLLETQQPVTCELLDATGSAASVHIPQAGPSSLSTGNDQADLSASGYQPGPDASMVHTDKGLSVILVGGSITDQKNVDAILSTPKAGEDVRGTVISNAVYKAAGDSIKTEFKKKAPNGIKFGDVIKTSGGKLAVKAIYHAPVNHYDKGVNNEESILRRILQDCFSLANNDGMTSLALPAMGLGNLKWPQDLIINIIFDEILAFSRKTNPLVLKEIHIAIFEDEHMKAFKKHTTNLTRPSTLPTIPQTSSIISGPDVVFEKGPSSDSVQTKEGIIISVKKGSIAAEQADILVNTTSRDMNLGNSGVSKAILTVGGQSIQDECQQQVPTEINFGSIVETSAGTLSAKKIYHSAFPTWDCGETQCKQILSSFLKQCFDRGSSDNHTSIALPAIGTGNLNYPRDFVAKVIFEEASDFSRRNSQSSLKDIRIIIYSGDTETVKAFDDYLRNLRNPQAQNAAAVASQQIAPQASTLPILLAEVSADKLEASVNNVHLVVKKGDITQDVTEAIVCSTNDSLDYTQGAAACAVKKAAGKPFEAEIKALGKPVPGITMTGAGNLPSKHVIHMIAPSKNDGWQSVIMETLQFADTKQIKSIAFPAVGTGQMNYPPADMAQMMLSTVKDFVTNKSPQFLKELHITVFDGKVFAAFKPAPSNSKQSPTQQPSFLVRGAGFIKGILQKGFKKGQTHQYASIRRSNPRFKPAVLRIYGMSADAIRAAETYLKDAIQDKTQTFNFENEQDKKIIANLSKDQVEKLAHLADTHDIIVHIEQSPTQPFIRLEGSPLDVTSCSQQVRLLLQQTSTLNKDIEHANVLSREVIWEYKDSSGFQAFDHLQSYHIEQAHHDKDDSHIWTVANNSHKIDFKHMTYCINDDPATQKDVRRFTQGAGSIALPRDWTRIPQGKRYTLESLQASSQEYCDVEAGFKKTCPKHQVLKIDRVQCPIQYQAYQLKKQDLQSKCPSDVQVEKTLYHGTSADVLESINTTGFNRSYCGKNATRFGKGVYFAVNASYSAQSRYSTTEKAQGCRYMYQCKVLTGQYIKGDPKLIVPPPKDPKDPNDCYDSVVDNMKKTEMFVVFFDNLAYPEYLITFK